MRGRCAACEAIFDPDVERGDEIDVAVRREPAAGEMTRVLAHRWCRPSGPGSGQA
jgi:hypothetical protein